MRWTPATLALGLALLTSAASASQGWGEITVVDVSLPQGTATAGNIVAMYLPNTSGVTRFDGAARTLNIRVHTTTFIVFDFAPTMAPSGRVATERSTSVFELTDATFELTGPPRAGLLGLFTTHALSAEVIAASNADITVAHDPRLGSKVSQIPESDGSPEQEEERFSFETRAEGDYLRTETAGLYHLMGEGTFKVVGLDLIVRDADEEHVIHTGVNAGRNATERFETDTVAILEFSELAGTLETTHPVTYLSDALDASWTGEATINQVRGVVTAEGRTYDARAGLGIIRGDFQAKLQTRPDDPPVALLLFEGDILSATALVQGPLQLETERKAPLQLFPLSFVALSSLALLGATLVLVRRARPDHVKGMMQKKFRRDGQWEIEYARMLMALGNHDEATPYVAAALQKDAKYAIDVQTDEAFSRVRKDVTIREAVTIALREHNLL